MSDMDRLDHAQVTGAAGAPYDRDPCPICGVPTQHNHHDIIDRAVSMLHEHGNHSECHEASRCRSILR